MNDKLFSYIKSSIISNNGDVSQAAYLEYDLLLADFDNESKTMFGNDLNKFTAFIKIFDSYKYVDYKLMGDYNESI